MKKSTIIIILVVMITSVFVVGIFGVKSVPYEEIVYVDKIEPTRVTYGNDQVAEIQYNSNLGYFVDIPYTENMLILVDYEVTPATATNKTLRVEWAPLNVNSDAEISDRGEIILKDSGGIVLTYRATDSARGISMVIYIYTHAE